MNYNSARKVNKIIRYSLLNSLKVATDTLIVVVYFKNLKG